eukprot:9625089-Alexandrium_andersonii.AAC.1
MPGLAAAGAALVASRLSPQLCGLLLCPTDVGQRQALYLDLDWETKKLVLTPTQDVAIEQRLEHLWAWPI